MTSALRRELTKGGERCRRRLTKEGIFDLYASVVTVIV